MNISPKPRLLYSLRAERGDIIRLCSEAVDNSFDASARNVRIEIDKQEIRFIDDGDGVLLKNFPALFTYGDHVELTGTKLGRFGVGIFVQSLNAADVMEVRSISEDGCHAARVNWRSVIRDGFDVPDPTPFPFTVGAGTGTTITLAMIRRLKPHTIDGLADALAQRFYPAIADGRAIQINGAAVPLLAEPKMLDVVNQTFEFSGGRRATLHAGLLARPSKLNRVHVAFGHRVIKGACTWGCGSHTGLDNMFARVQLIGSGWALTAFKDDLFDEDQRDELEDAIEDAITPILEKCRNASMEARVASIGELINAMVPPELAPARPKRKKKETRPASDRKTKSPGTVKPDESDPADGPAKTERPQRDRLLITWEGREAEHGIGWFEPGTRVNRVHLSPDNPSIMELFQERDNRFVALALLIIAVLMFEYGREAIPSQKQLQFLAYGVRVARHLATNTNVVFRPGVA